MSGPSPHSEQQASVIRHAISSAMIGSGGQLLAVQALDNLLEQLRKMEHVAQAALDTEHDALRRVDELEEQFDALHRAFERFADDWEAAGTTEIYGPVMAAEIRKVWRDALDGAPYLDRWESPSSPFESDMSFRSFPK